MSNVQELRRLCRQDAVDPDHDQLEQLRRGDAVDPDHVYNEDYDFFEYYGEPITARSVAAAESVLPSSSSSLAVVVPTTPSPEKKKSPAKTTIDLLFDDVTRTADAWRQRIGETERELRENRDTNQQVIEGIQRQVWDGLLTRNTAYELEHVLKLWTRLHAALAIKKELGIVHENQDREIIDTLLDLFAVQQISRTFFADIVLHTRRHRDDDDDDVPAAKKKKKTVGGKRRRRAV